MLERVSHFMFTLFIFVKMFFSQLEEDSDVSEPFQYCNYIIPAIYRSGNLWISDYIDTYYSAA